MKTNCKIKQKSKQQVYLLYRTDEHLLNESKELLYIGRFANCIKAAKKLGATESQLSDLSTLMQTQLNNTDYEFIIEQHSLNDYIIEP